ncbi:MAG: hypothetical protein H6835_10800 [Planctomycetes bacterium]|nr:hypothetical protein [Planctomycetota bacterium]
MFHPREDPERDERTLQLLIAGDTAGIRQLLEDHGGVVLSFLRRKFHLVLGDWQLEQTLGMAALRLWQTATRIDRELGSLRAWFALMSRNCGLALLARQQGQTPVLLDCLSPSPLGIGTSMAELRHMQLVVDVHHVIAQLDELPRAVLTADLEAGDEVPAPLLASQCGVSSRDVIAARSTGRRILRRRLEELGHGDEQRLAARLRGPREGDS